MLREDGEWSPILGGASEAEAVADMTRVSSQSHSRRLELNPLVGQHEGWGDRTLMAIGSDGSCGQRTVRMVDTGSVEFHNLGTAVCRLPRGGGREL